MKAILIRCCFDCPYCERVRADIDHWGVVSHYACTRNSLYPIEDPTKILPQCRLPNANGDEQNNA